MAIFKESKKTKIVCTIGPASESPEVLQALMRAGMNVARLNFSHGSYEEHAKKMETIRQERQRIGKFVAILLDTKGPEIRTGKFEGGQASFKQGQTVDIYMNEILGDNTKFSVSYKGLYDDVHVGSVILVNDGSLELTVLKKSQDIISCLVKNDAKVKDTRGINVPNVRLNMPYISEKDHADIVFGCEQDVDFIAASFARRAQDILDIKNILKQHGKPDIKIIAKIENQEGVDNVDEILEVSDGIMIARGDLGVEVNKEEVPLIQKSIIHKCIAKSKVSITATQMLESMQENPRPTRAEVSDVANAILDGTDAIMLSGESAIGKYPIEAVETMTSIAKRIERAIDYRSFIKFGVNTATKQVDNAIVASVAEIVYDFDVDTIVVFTVSGSTARRLSRLKPMVPVIAATMSEKVALSLALNWGVKPILTDLINNFDVEAVERANGLAKLMGYKPGATMIITGGTAQRIGSTSFLRIEEIV